MGTAKYVSVQLARFERLRGAGEVEGELPEGTLFCAVGADWRAGGSDVLSQEAFVFLVVGLHESLSSAESWIGMRGRALPWMAEAREIYQAVLQPYRHKGELNWLNREEPGLVFETLGEAVGSDEPFVAITSVGWKVGPDLDMNRVRDFGNGVATVRIAMTGLTGLHSQQTFGFDKGIATDPVTLTFWKDDAAVRQFAYGPAVHKMQMDRYRAMDTADRTSFTRFRVVSSEGTWYGRDPQNWGA